tara:strand:+ start:322 stop:741 length:420 start_codon:yes stop_codon:yes gene_type:complete
VTRLFLTGSFGRGDNGSFGRGDDGTRKLDIECVDDNECADEEVDDVRDKREEREEGVDAITEAEEAERNKVLPCRANDFRKWGVAEEVRRDIFCLPESNILGSMLSSISSLSSSVSSSSTVTCITSSSSSSCRGTQFRL